MLLLVILLILIATGAIGGGSYYATTRVKAPPIVADIPYALGYRSHWIVVKTSAEDAVISALGLTKTFQTDWRSATGFVLQGGIYVTPSIDNWTIAYGIGLPAPQSPEAVAQIRALLEKLSAQHREAHYYCSDRPGMLYGWIRAEQGSVTRMCTWNLALGTKAWEEGTPSPMEKPLLEAFTASQTAPQVGQMMSHDELVMRVASACSLRFVDMGRRIDILQKRGWTGRRDNLL